MTDRPMDQHAIKAEISRRGLTLSRIAEINGMNPSRISRALMGADYRAALAVAKALGMPFADLFSNIYPKRVHNGGDASRTKIASDRAKSVSRADKNRSAA